GVRQARQEAKPDKHFPQTAISQAAPNPGGLWLSAPPWTKARTAMKLTERNGAARAGPDMRATEVRNKEIPQKFLLLGGDHRVFAHPQPVMPRTRSVCSFTPSPEEKLCPNER